MADTPDDTNMLLRAWMEGWTAGHSTGFKSGWDAGRTVEQEHTQSLVARGKRIAAAKKQKTAS